MFHGLSDRLVQLTRQKPYTNFIFVRTTFACVAGGKAADSNADGVVSRYRVCVGGSSVRLPHPWTRYNRRRLGFARFTSDASSPVFRRYRQTSPGNLGVSFSIRRRFPPSPFLSVLCSRLNCYRVKGGESRSAARKLNISRRRLCFDKNVTRLRRCHEPGG